MSRFVFAVLCVCVSAAPVTGAAQQVVDSTFHPTVTAPAFAAGSGPAVLFDEAHNSFHSLSRSFRPFAELLRLDGYRVTPLEAKLSAAALTGADILVIVNVLAAENVGNWKLPTPSAYTPDEIEAVRRWVSDGGSLLLVADHMPFPGAAAELARALGFKFANNFAIDTATWDPLVFRRSDATLGSHPITNGRNESERIDSVVTFTGQAFLAAAPTITPLLTLRSGVLAFEPAVAWEFDGVDGMSASGMLQGATHALGNGRVVVLGEAAMLTAQIAGPNRRPMGMNAPNARQNQQFTLNVVHWLSGVLPVASTPARQPSAVKPKTSSRRRALIGAAVGAALGALAGAAAHGDSNEGGPAGFGDPPGKAENVMVGIAFGAIGGWLIGSWLGR
ncbi:MAG: hypothetical protein ACSLFE_11985 [Gemmatimonadaceae bacterium]